jgi:hypothetical protein
MKLLYGLLGMWILSGGISAWAGVVDARCPAVNCDCAAIQDAQWRQTCEAREAQVINDCLANQGKPKTFCGLHGPKAFPVSISLQPQNIPVVSDAQDFDTLRQLITTQTWSLDESFKVLQSREQAQQFGDAIQVLSLLERDTERLHGLHRQALSRLQQAQKPVELQEQGASFSGDTLALAKKMRTYSEQLWQSAQAAKNERALKAYRALSLKSGRLAAEIYEFAADLYSETGKIQDSALAWQAAAEVAQSLVAWERAGDNKPQHVEFYQAQAAARWHRATYLWLGVGNQEAVRNSSQRAVAVSNKNEKGGLVKADYDPHNTENDSRAIKRGSR